MDKLCFRTLHADEIECRVGTTNSKGCSLLLYKNARVDMQLLDEVVGADRWQRTHELINGNLFCSVEILFDNQWVKKQDVGVESYTEKEKGQASDAFKRACVNWGIGRELYTAPFIWINLADGEWVDRGGKKSPSPYIGFHVSHIEYDEQHHIVALIIADKNNAERFRWQSQSYSKVLLTKASKEIDGCTNRDELTKVYKKYIVMKDNQEFLTIVQKKAEEIANAKSQDK